MTTADLPAALIVAGGSPNHRPLEVAAIMVRELEQVGITAQISESLEVLSDPDALAPLSLVVINWHMGVEPEQQRPDLRPLLDAVHAGTGLAGIHAGLGDAFRLEVDFQFMVGGQWVAHPGDDGVRYRVEVADRDHPITAEVDDFDVISEKYSMHVDPAIHVLATTDFDGVAMPIAWTRDWGHGRVFYSSLGHTPQIVEMPPALRLLRQGMQWAADGGRPRGDARPRGLSGPITAR